VQRHLVLERAVEVGIEECDPAVGGPSNEPSRLVSRNATQPSEALTTMTGNASVLRPLPLTSPAGGRPSGSSRNTPRYHVVDVVRRPIRPAPRICCSVGAGNAVSGIRPSPEKSRSSITLGAPVLVAISPGTPGSTPLSRIAISTPRPSYVGCSARKRSTPVLFNGIRPSI